MTGTSIKIFFSLKYFSPKYVGYKLTIVVKK